MLKIGLTGGIGSGKSIVAKIFAVLGAPVYQADRKAKELMEQSPDLVKEITNAFSSAAYVNGKLDTRFLSEIVFADKRKLEELNAIIHPHVIQDGREWMNRQTYPYAIKEAALIFESGSQSEYDVIIGVHAPQSLRIHRTMQRDRIDREKVLQRMDNQLDESIKLKLCDIIIMNDEQQMLIPQVLAVHERLLNWQNQQSQHG